MGRSRDYRKFQQIRCLALPCYLAHREHLEVPSSACLVRLEYLLVQINAWETLRASSIVNLVPPRVTFMPLYIGLEIKEKNATDHLLDNQHILLIHISQ